MQLFAITPSEIFYPYPHGGFLPPPKFFTLRPDIVTGSGFWGANKFIILKTKQMKHTQGEWMQFKGNIVTKSKSTLPIDYDTNICKMNANLDEAEANANLIKSAPEMLNLLEWIIKEIENTPWNFSESLLGLIKIKANKAIKKATE